MQKPVIPPPDYTLAIQQARIRNVAQFRSTLTHSNTIQKLQNYAERHQHEFETILYKAKTDDIFAEQFAIDPIKQSIHEKTAAAHIKKTLPLCFNFQNLPTNALYLHQLAPLPTESNFSHSKSIDFSWDYSLGTSSLNAYATHKFTDQEGGAQENQYNDLIRFIEEASPLHTPSLGFFVLCDGPYYLRHRRLEHLRTLAIHHNPLHPVNICTTATLPETWAASLLLWATATSTPLPPTHIDIIHSLLA